MAGDPAFANPNTPAATPPAAPAGTPPSYVTQEAFATFQGQMKQFADRMIQVVQQSRAAAPAATPPPAAPGDVAAKLLEDPTGVITGILSKWYQDNVAPVQRITMSDTADQLLAGERTSFDAEFGAGSFDKHILPQFNATLEHMGPQKDVVRANRSSVQQLVAAAKGSQWAVLEAAKSAHVKATADAAAANPPQPPYLVGTNIGPRPAKGELTPNEQGIVDRAKHVAGDGFEDMQELLALREAWGSGLGASAPGAAHPGVSVDAVRGFVQDMAKK